MDAEEAAKTLTFHGVPLRDGWQAGEVKPVGLTTPLVGATFVIGSAVQSVVGHVYPNLAELFAAALGLFLIWVGGKGMSWNDKGVTSWLYGRKIKWRSWEDFTSPSMTKLSLASILRQNDKNPDSPMTRFFVATQVYKQMAHPMNRTYEQPPSLLRSVGHSVAGVGMAAVVSYGAALLLPRPETGGEGGMWLSALVWGAYVGSVIAGSAFAAREFAKVREPWRWKPVAEPTFDFRLNRLSNRVARELLPGKYYMHKPPSSLLDGIGSGLTVFPLAAALSGVKMLDGTVSAEFFALAASIMTALSIAASGLSEWLKVLAKRRAAPVDDEVVVECTESGLRLWKKGKATGYLRYPHPLTTGSIWNRSTLESWSDGEKVFTIDRARLIEIPVYLPEAPYALTEGDGWLHPDSKAIADQMLAERDWSKPPPRTNT